MRYHFLKYSGAVFGMVLKIHFEKLHQNDQCVSYSIVISYSKLKIKFADSHPSLLVVSQNGSNF